jgi:hypothetical protein
MPSPACPPRKLQFVLDVTGKHSLLSLFTCSPHNLLRVLCEASQPLAGTAWQVASKKRCPAHKRGSVGSPPLLPTIPFVLLPCRQFDVSIRNLTMVNGIPSLLPTFGVLV